MAARPLRPIDAMQAVASLALLAAVDPELAAIAKRCEPSPDAEAQRAREREEENRLRRRDEVRRLREVARDAAGGVYGAKVRDTAREILAEGTSEVHLQRVRKLVTEWRRAGRARKAAKRR